MLSSRVSAEFFGARIVKGLSEIEGELLSLQLKFLSQSYMSISDANTLKAYFAPKQSLDNYV